MAVVLRNGGAFGCACSCDVVGVERTGAVELACS